MFQVFFSRRAVYNCHADNRPLFLPESRDSVQVQIEVEVILDIFKSGKWDGLSEKSILSQIPADLDLE